MKITKLVAVFLTALLGQTAQAEILIGQTAGFTGPAAPSVQAMSMGAKLIIDAANAEGGVRGEQIKLIQIDDENNVKRAGENARRLIEEQKVLALFLNRGTPHTAEMLPILKSHGVPLIAPSTGAMSLHTPVVREVFNVRPTYQYEAEKLVGQLAAMNVGDKIGVVYLNDGFGKDALAGARRGFEAIKSKPVFEIAVDRETEDVGPALEAASKPVNGGYPALIVVGTARPTTALIKKVRAAGINSYIATMSTNASDGFIDGLGEHAKYVIVSQAFPSERALHIPLVKKVSELMKAKGSAQQLSPAVLEGAAGAEVLVEALRRCEKPCSSAKLITVLESKRPFPIGILDQEIIYSKTDHSGMRYTDTSIIVAGKFRR